MNEKANVRFYVTTSNDGIETIVSVADTIQDAAKAADLLIQEGCRGVTIRQTGGNE